MYPKITYSLLVEKNACKPQLDLFEKHFGKVKAIPLTKSIVSKFGSVFNIDWAASNLLTPKDFKEYNKVKAPALEEYKKVKAQAWEEYNKVKAQAFVEIYKKGMKKA